MKKIIGIMLFSIMCFALFACNNDSREEGTAINMNNENILDQLDEIDDWLSTYYNDGAYELSWYLSKGTSSTGGNINPEITIKKYKKLSKEAKKHDKFIMSIEDGQFSALKEAWTMTYEEIKKIDDYVATHDIVANGDPSFNVDLLKQACDYYDSCLEDLEDLNDKD